MQNRWPPAWCFGDNANMGKLLAFKAYWHAAESCLQRHGSFGYAREYDAEHMLGMPRLL